MPLQSGSDAVLKAMRRSYRRRAFLGIIDRVRAAIPDAAITTDIIVGFPGETEEDFQATLDVVAAGPVLLGVHLPVLAAPGTPAGTCEDQVPGGRRRAVRAPRRPAGARSPPPRTGAGGPEVEVLVAEGEGRKDGATHRISGRAADNRLVHFALPAAWPRRAPRPGDVVTVEVTHGAPHHLVADAALAGGTFAVRRTRAGDAWERGRDAATDRRVPGPGVPPRSLGMPALRPAPERGGGGRRRWSPSSARRRR